MDGKILGLAHIGLFVQDIERSKKFYQDILEFTVVYECSAAEPDGTTTKVAFVKNGDCTIEIVHLEKAQKRTDGPVDHIALKVQNIEAVRDRLAQKGIEFESKEITFNKDFFANGSKWILFRGPDGEHLEINEVM